MKIIKQAQLESAVSELLGMLQERTRIILIKRFGLGGDATQTLDSIGKDFEISRERVRQIESSSFNFLRNAKKTKELEMITLFIYKVLQENGGFLDRKSFKKKIFGKSISLIQKNQLAFLLNSLSKLHYQKDTIYFNGVWYFLSKKSEARKAKSIHDKFVQYFTETGSVVKLKDLENLIQTDFFNEKEKKFFQGGLSSTRLEIILNGSKLIGKNIINEWGLLSWNIIAQKYVKEKALLILKKYKKPLHFRELTERMNENWNDKKTLPQTVHNVIIKYEEFIFVAPGTYTVKKK